MYTLTTPAWYMGPFALMLTGEPAAASAVVAVACVSEV